MNSESTIAQVLIAKDGPYIVSGDVALSLQNITPNPTGGCWEWKEGRKFEVTPQICSLPMRPIPEEAVL